MMLQAGGWDGRAALGKTRPAMRHAGVARADSQRDACWPCGPPPALSGPAHLHGHGRTKHDECFHLLRTRAARKMMCLRAPSSTLCSLAPAKMFVFPKKGPRKMPERAYPGRPGLSQVTLPFGRNETSQIGQHRLWYVVLLH